MVDLTASNRGHQLDTFSGLARKQNFLDLTYRDFPAHKVRRGRRTNSSAVNLDDDSRMNESFGGARVYSVLTVRNVAM